MNSEDDVQIPTSLARPRCNRCGRLRFALILSGLNFAEEVHLVILKELIRFSYYSDTL